MPRTPDGGGWHTDASRYAGEELAAVGTSILALRQDDDLYGPYLRVSTAKAEKSGSRAADELTSVQPPDGARDGYDNVTTALEDASDVLTDVRLAAWEGNTASYPALLQRLEKVRDRLEQIVQSLQQGSDGSTA